MVILEQTKNYIVESYGVNYIVDTGRDGHRETVGQID